MTQPTHAPESISLWKAAKAGDDVKVKQIITEAPEGQASSFLDWTHDTKGTTPLMVAAEHEHGESAVLELLAAGANVNAVDAAQTKNTALHYAAMSNKDPLITEALIKAGANLYETNRKNLTPLDLARQHHQTVVGAVLLEYMKLHSGWIYMRAKYHWQQRWGVLVACNQERTSAELCLYKKCGELRPKTVLLVDESSRSSECPSNDSFSCLKRDNAFTFDKPVMVQSVSRQKLTRAPTCHKTMSQQTVETHNLVLAADSQSSAKRWRQVLENSPLYDQETGEPLFDIPEGELYYWPQDVAKHVRESVLEKVGSQQEEGAPVKSKSVDTAEPEAEATDEKPVAASTKA